MMTDKNDDRTTTRQNKNVTHRLHCHTYKGTYTPQKRIDTKGGEAERGNKKGGGELKKNKGGEGLGWQRSVSIEEKGRTT